MEIEVTQEKLSRSLNIVSKVAMGARATLPILSSVLIKAENHKVSLTTTNLDMAIVDFVPVINSKDGVVAVPARLLAEFVNNIPRGEKITIKADGDKVKVSTDKYSSVINCADKDEFPELPGIEESKAVVFKVGVDQFSTSISEVIIATSNDTTRPVLTGVYFNTDNNALYVAATDGYRLAEKKLISKVKSEMSAIVPTNSLQEVMRSISDDVDEVEILFDETQVRFRVGEVEITSKLIDGTYPNYKQLIPKESEIEAVLNLDELTRIAKMAAIFARESNRAIVCEADDKAGVFSVSSIANEVGENKSEIEAKINKSGKVKIDSRYLMDVLNILKEEKVKFKFNTGNDPIIVQNEKNPDYTHIIMPLAA